MRTCARRIGCCEFAHRRIPLSFFSIVWGHAKSTPRLYPAQQPSSFSAFHPHLSHLSLLSITYPRSTIAPSEFYTALGGLIERAPSLREFTHYSSGAARPFGAASAGSDDDDEDDDGEGGAEFASHPTPAHGPSSGGGGGMSGPRLPNSFFKRLVASRGPYLTRFRVHGIGMSMDQVGALCESCTKLEDLVIHIYEDQLVCRVALYSLASHLTIDPSPSLAILFLHVRARPPPSPPPARTASAINPPLPPARLTFSAHPLLGKLRSGHVRRGRTQPRTGLWTRTQTGRIQESGLVG